MQKGNLVVIEGSGDGIGKSTQVAYLKEHLNNDGIDVYMHHFPTYDTSFGELIVKYLKGELGTDKSKLSPYFINTLYAMDRAAQWSEKLGYIYENGGFILLDRYTTSSIIYQSVYLSLDEKKRFIDYVRDFEYNKLGIAEPDKVIFLHAPFELTTELRNKRFGNPGVSNDIHERDLDFMKRVYENSMWIADYLGWDDVDCAPDGNKFASIDDIHKKVYQKVKSLDVK